MGLTAAAAYRRRADAALYAPELKRIDAVLLRQRHSVISPSPASWLHV
jgi:hypothetical protein